jgi:hypothetical protein
VTTIGFLLESVIMGIVVGVIANAIFLLTLSRLRPKIQVSPQIARGSDTLSGAVRCRIKVINRTRSPVTDINAQLHLMWPRQEAGGSIYRSRQIPLVQSKPVAIQRYSSADKEADYAYRFSTEVQLDEIWQDDSQQFLPFRLTCRHSFSGFGRFFEQDYRVKRKTLKDGSFAKGDTFEIV